MSRNLLTRCLGFRDMVFNRAHKSVRLFCLTLPHNDRSPTQFAQSALMEFVTGGVAFEFLQPPGAAVHGRRAILTAPVPVPEAAVNEDGGFVFRKKNIRSHKPTSDP